MQQSHNNLSRCVGSPANGYWPYDYVININWKPKIYNLHTYNYFINLVFYICKIVNNPAKYQTIFLDPYFITVPYFVKIDTIIILMKNRKNEQKPLYNEENGLYWPPSWFRGVAEEPTRGQYCPFFEVI